MSELMRWVQGLAARLFEKVDLPLLLALLGIMLISLVVLSSASGANSRLVRCTVPDLPAIRYGAPAAAERPVPVGPCITATMPALTAARSADDGISRSPAGCGSGTFGALKPACADFSRCRRWRTPSLASIAVAIAICSGLVTQKPWPMPALTVSPGYQSTPIVRCFQLRDGRTPGISPARSMPVGAPKPSRPMNVSMRSTPSSSASLK